MKLNFNNNTIYILNLSSNSTGSFLSVIDIASKYSSIDISTIKRVNSF